MTGVQTCALPIWIEALGSPVTAKLRIHYMSASGELTVRTVQVTHFQVGEAEVHFVGYCELRNEKRAFRAARVSRAYDLGASLQIASLVSWFQSQVPCLPKATSLPDPNRPMSTADCPFCVFAKYGGLHTASGACLHCGQIRIQACAK